MDDPPTPSKRLRPSSPSQCLTCGHEIYTCIICQEIDPQCGTTSTENGRARLIEAAAIRKDEVYERLKLADHTKFVYHVSNVCYKSYTHKHKLEQCVQLNTSVDPHGVSSSQENSTLSSRKRQSMVESRDQVTKPDDVNILSIQCAKCRKIKHSKEYENFDPNGASSSQENSTLSSRKRRSMVESRDPVTNPDDVNIFSKKCVICRKVNSKEYEKFRISEKNSAEAFLKAASNLQDDVFTRTCDLQDANAVFAADLYCHKLCIRNYIRKGEQLISKSKKESLSGEQQGTNIQVNVVNESELSALDVMKRSGVQLRETILKQDFHLKDKLCDASELEKEYHDIVIPNDVATFFSALFDLENMQEDITTDDQQEETESQSGKFKKVLSLYQTIFHMVHNGRKCTPLLNSEELDNTN